MRRTPEFSRKIVLLFGDLCCIILAIYTAYFLRYFAIEHLFTTYTGATVFSLAIYFMSFYIFDLYNLSHPFKSTYFLTRFLSAVAIGSAVAAIVFYLLPSWKSASRGIFLINAGLIAALVYSWRLFFQNVYAPRLKHKRIAVVGAGYAGQTLCAILKKNRIFAIKHFLDDNKELHGKYVESHRIEGDSKLLYDLVKNKEIDAIVVAISHEKHAALLKTLFDVKLTGIEIYDMPELYEELTGKLPVVHLRDAWVVYTRFHGLRRALYVAHIKRLMDLCLATIGIIVCMPLMLTAALAVKLSSKGPVLFKQKRVGLNGKVYEIIKFRSMQVDAERSGAVWAKENDPRATPVGRVLRMTRVDELPQMLNVLRGEMSFIGPRPERPEFIAALSKEIPFYPLRHAIKPGITGWAQVNYKYGASKEDALEKLQFDLYYIKNLTVFLDLHTILKTVRVMLFNHGAR